MSKVKYSSAYSRPPVLTRERVRLAYAVAVATDVLQLALGPFGWAFADEMLDVAAMVLTWRLIGFHPLLLPTFILEFLSGGNVNWPRTSMQSSFVSFRPS